MIAEGLALLRRDSRGDVNAKNFMPSLAFERAGSPRRLGRRLLKSAAGFAVGT
ncbi:MAG: hypothetical protein SGJ19_16770 [Planctomycetia bacterium]|nr:hypothetical protein [Planctomycetia bacterium]